MQCATCCTQLGHSVQCVTCCTQLGHSVQCATCCTQLGHSVQCVTCCTQLGHSVQCVTCCTRLGHSVQCVTCCTQLGHSVQCATCCTQLGHSVQCVTCCTQLGHSVQCATCCTQLGSCLWSCSSLPFQKIATIFGESESRLDCISVDSASLLVCELMWYIRTYVHVYEVVCLHCISCKDIRNLGCPAVHMLLFFYMYSTYTYVCTYVLHIQVWIASWLSY